MVQLSVSGLALTAAAVLPTLVSALDQIDIMGPYFVSNSTGNRFPIIGVDYQPGGSSGFSAKADPLSDATACLRDAILMQQLGVNTIRVYNLDANLNHDECVSIFNAAGIYMVLDVNSGLYGQYLDRTDPSSTYTVDYLNHIFSIVEAFKDYPNLLGFFAANEVINEQSSYDAPLYVRAVVRDLKEYIALHSTRSIGVGYAAADVSAMLMDTWNYFDCVIENSTDSKIDFFGLNDYEWCGDSSFTVSGYNTLVSEFQSADIPVFFSEYGCIQPRPRNFTNVPVLYGSQMTALSGGLVYEFSEESDNYGLVAINSSAEVTLLVDYTYLQEEFLSIDMGILTTSVTAVSTTAAATCSAGLITSGLYNAWDLPSRPSGGDSLVTSGATSTTSGAIVSVMATTMPATVNNITGVTVDGLVLVELGCGDSNFPGLVNGVSSVAGHTCTYTAATQTGASSTATGSSSATSSSAAVAVRAPPFDPHAVLVMGAVLVSFLAGALVL